MEQSLTLLTAHVHFLDTELVLIHIPLRLYTYFVAPIIQLLVPARTSVPEATDDPSTEADQVRSQNPWAYDHPFVNVSVTPVECSIACSRALAEKLFQPMINGLSEATRPEVSISTDQYVVIQVDGEGVEAGQRVVELTAPLAMNGIPIFFITTYFSDYILVPVRCRETVISALEDRGFVFEASTEAFVNVQSPFLHASMSNSRNNSSHSHHNINPFEATFASDRPPSTPPPSSVAELEARTFDLMSKRQIEPLVDPSLELIACAGRRDSTMREGSDAANHAARLLESRLEIGLVRCLIRMPRARFFSITLTDTEPASLVMEKELLAEFEDPGNEDDQLLLGNKHDVLIPITLDLRKLPMESTGIVCGVSARLVGGLKLRPGSRDATSPGSADNGSFNEEDNVEMSYLSTARAGTVMVAKTQLERALECLKAPPPKLQEKEPTKHVPLPPSDPPPTPSKAVPIPIRRKK